MPSARRQVAFLHTGGRVEVRNLRDEDAHKIIQLPQVSEIESCWAGDTVSYRVKTFERVDLHHPRACGRTGYIYTEVRA